MKVTAIGVNGDHVKLERRARLAEAVTRMAIAIASDACTPPDLIELKALALICEEHQLPIDAARVRRWIPAEPG